MPFILYILYSTLSCRVIQDFDLSKFDNLWRHSVDTKWFKITRMEYLWKLFLYRTWTLYSCYTHHRVPVWHLYGNTILQALSIQKVKSDFSSFKKCYLLLLFILSRRERIWTLHITSTKMSLEQQIRHFSFLEGRGVLTTMVTSSPLPWGLSICTDFFISHHFCVHIATSQVI